MTTTRTGLPPDLIFEPDGHVSDLCLTCIADGEINLVPRTALDHLDACDACGARLGEAALASVEAGEALRDPLVAAALHAAPSVVAAVPAVVAPAPEASAPLTPRKARRPLPIAAIAAALLVAVVTAGPALVDAVAGIPSLFAAAVGWWPALVRLAQALIASGPSASGPWALAIKGVSAFVFVLLGLQVARVGMRRRAVVVEGGRR
ncbi:MAG: hypothetical protein QM820_14200 [Minicystis sp.]